MFGSEYSKHPEILMQSFTEMKHEYKSKSKRKKGGLLPFLQGFYIGIFGIPEIGFQLRSLYFMKMMEFVNEKKIKKITDAGSGIATYAVWLSKNYPKTDIIGYEIDSKKLSFSEKFTRELGINNATFKFNDISKKSKWEASDLVVNIDVLEHIENYKAVLRNFYNCLQKGGYLYIHTPQPDQKRIFKELDKWHHEDHVHEGFKPEELRKELNNLGFKIVEMKNTFGFFGSLAWELNHIMLSKNFILAGLTYPFLYLLANLDLLTTNKAGLGTAVLARKK